MGKREGSEGGPEAAEWLVKALAGSTAGVISTCLCSPLDVAKTRAQVRTLTAWLGWPERPSGQAGPTPARTFHIHVQHPPSPRRRAHSHPHSHAHGTHRIAQIERAGTGARTSKYPISQPSMHASALTSASAPANVRAGRECGDGRARAQVRRRAAGAARHLPGGGGGGVVPGPHAHHLLRRDILVRLAPACWHQPGCGRAARTLPPRELVTARTLNSV